MIGTMETTKELCNKNLLLLQFGILAQQQIHIIKNLISSQILSCEVLCMLADFLALTIICFCPFNFFWQVSEVILNRDEMNERLERAVKPLDILRGLFQDNAVRK